MTRFDCTFVHTEQAAQKCYRKKFEIHCLENFARRGKVWKGKQAHKLVWRKMKIVADHFTCKKHWTKNFTVFTCSFPFTTDLLFSEIEMCYLIHQWNLILLKNKIKFNVFFGVQYSWRNFVTSYKICVPFPLCSYYSKMYSNGV